MEVYAFMHCPCTEESAFGLISLHKTAKGAYKAMRKDMIREYNEAFERHIRFKKYSRGSKLLPFQLWKVSKIKVGE